jgi:hypothetical protein
MGVFGSGVKMDKATATETFRNRYRATEIGRNYRGKLHFSFTTVSSIAVIAFCLLQLEFVSIAEWLVLPATFLYANLVEYWGHRFPMHHPVRGLNILYRRHTRQHHRFFTHTEMTFGGTRDFKAVLFPPVMIAFFIGGFATPMWIVLLWLATPNVAWLAVATGMAYFLNYEWLHFAYHSDPDSWIGRIPGVHRLRRLHRDHHNPALMSHYNFNITYPVGDWLFGTRYRS